MSPGGGRNCCCAADALGKVPLNVQRYRRTNACQGVDQTSFTDFFFHGGRGRGLKKLAETGACIGKTPGRKFDSKPLQGSKYFVRCVSRHGGLELREYTADSRPSRGFSWLFFVSLCATGTTLHTVGNAGKQKRISLKRRQFPSATINFSKFRLAK